MFSLAAAGLFLIWYTHSHFTDFRMALLEADVRFLVLSLIVLTGFHMVQGYLIADILRALGARVGILETLRVVLLSLVGKYVPGKVWILTMRSTLLSERGVSVRLVLAATGIEHVYVIASAVVLFLLTSTPHLATVASAQRALGIGLLIALLVAPGLILRGANKVLLLFGRDGIQGGITRKRSAFYTFMFILTWILLGAGIWVLSQGMSAGISYRSIPELAGLYAFSVVAGFVAFFAPGGIGVREGLFVLALKDLMPGADALFPRGRAPWCPEIF